MLKSVLVVCSGNTCRSVMAAALLRHYAREAGIEIKVESAGIAAFAGDNATAQTQEVMEEIGLDVKDHRSRLMHPEWAEEFDLILVMTAQHKAHIGQLLPGLEEKVYMLKEFADLQHSVGQEPVVQEEKVYDISDPFGQSLDVYRAARDEIAAAMRAIVQKWQEVNENDENSGRQ